jgi:hypothetical protein
MSQQQKRDSKQAFIHLADPELEGLVNEDGLLDFRDLKIWFDDFKDEPDTFKVPPQSGDFLHLPWIEKNAIWEESRGVYFLYQENPNAPLEVRELLSIEHPDENVQPYEFTFPKFPLGYFNSIPNDWVVWLDEKTEAEVTRNAQFGLCPVLTSKTERVYSWIEHEGLTYWIIDACELYQEVFDCINYTEKERELYGVTLRPEEAKQRWLESFKQRKAREGEQRIIYEMRDRTGYAHETSSCPERTIYHETIE